MKLMPTYDGLGRRRRDYLDLETTKESYIPVSYASTSSDTPEVPMSGYSGIISSNSNCVDVWVNWNGQSVRLTKTAGEVAFYTDNVWNGWTRSFNATNTNNTGWVVREGVNRADSWETWDTRIETQWGMWNSPFRAGNAPAVHIPRQPTQEELQADMAQRRARDQAYAEAERMAKEKRDKAKKKAEMLLLFSLTDEQKKHLKERDCFYLYVGNKKYRVDRGSHGNVHLVRTDITPDKASVRDDRRGMDELIESYCIQPNAGCPDEDAMLAQKLLLESNEQEFRRIANITTYRGRRAA